MIWLHPLAWLGIVSVAAPILIHLLVHKHAPPLKFPTLRFLQPSRLASIRRRALEDLPLLAVRAAILAAAVAALAGPLLLTASRRAALDARVARAVVTSDANSARARQEASAAFRGIVIATGSEAEGVRRGVAWLADVPPARREILVLAPLALGSISQRDVSAVPAGIGLRLERTGDVASVLDVNGSSTLGPLIAPGQAQSHKNTVALDGERTRVTDAVSGEVRLPIEIAAPAGSAHELDAALAAVLSQRVFASAPNHTARLLVAGSPAVEDAARSSEAVHSPWIADAAAAIARDESAAAWREAPSGLTDDRFTRTPWLTLARAADGRPIVAAAEQRGSLVVISGVPASTVGTPLLLRALLNGLSIPGETHAEILPISDARLQAWRRPAGEIPASDLRRSDEDDRRWLWAAVLTLVALESWMRRLRARDAAAGADGTESSEATRVA